MNFDKNLIPNLTITYNLGKLYLLPKIHKRLSNVRGRPVISNCGAPTEKVSEFRNCHMQTLMRKGWSYLELVSAIFYQIFIFTPNHEKIRNYEKGFFFFHLKVNSQYI